MQTPCKRKVGSLSLSSGTIYAPLAQLVERTTVNRVVPGSNPGGGAIYVSLAQLVEHKTFNFGVIGSIPVRDTICRCSLMVER